MSTIVSVENVDVERDLQKTQNAWNIHHIDPTSGNPRLTQLLGDQRNCFFFQKVLATIIEVFKSPTKLSPRYYKKISFCYVQKKSLKLVMKSFAIIFAILYPMKALIIHREIGKVRENFTKHLETLLRFKIFKPVLYLFCNFFYSSCYNTRCYIYKYIASFRETSDHFPVRTFP